MSVAAGCLDAISFVGFGGVFTANMTGNTVLLGIALASMLGHVSSKLGVAPPGIAILAFVAGAVATAPILRRGFDASRAGTIVAVESAIVALAGILFAFWHAPPVIPLCIALLSFTMGAQSVAVAKAGLPGITSTYVTGTMITGIMRAIAARNDEQHDRHRREAANDGIAWIAYLAGAVIGTTLLLTLRQYALLVTAVLFAAHAVWVTIRSLKY